MLIFSRFVRVVVAAALAAAFLLATPQVASADHADGHKSPVASQLGDICGAAETDQYDADGDLIVDADGNPVTVTHLMTYQLVKVLGERDPIVACAASNTVARPDSTLQDNLGLSPRSNESFKDYQRRCSEKFFNNRYAFELDDAVTTLIGCVALHYR
ncbi:hypothetical protein [Candidatus Poriferisodalis sp.]|uniref:hypothetical protein n=1 Tax=Candidatus Poriferisodalis sp. TaxID=3101277 RepID=UPI003B517A0F